MKHVKLWLYGQPGTGKSVFAYRLGKELQKIENSKKGPFFITTDGNYEWLEDFGADMNDCAAVTSWKDFKKVVGSSILDNYGTIVVDLVEDLYKWAQQEFCIANKLEYIGDASMGKGWAIVSDDYTSVLTKLINFNKHIIFVSHGDSTNVKSNRGVDSTYYFPTSKIRAKDCDTLEGRMRFVLRCYNEDEVSDTDGVQKIITKRYLSITPKPTEFSIFRGANVDVLPERIPLEPSDFIKVTNLINTKEVVIPTTDKIEDTTLQNEVKFVAPQVTEAPTCTPAVLVTKDKKLESVTSTIATPDTAYIPANNTELESAVKSLEKTNSEQEKKVLTPAERIAALKAKYAAAKKGN